MGGSLYRWNAVAADVGYHGIVRFGHIRAGIVCDIGGHTFAGEQSGPFPDQDTAYLCVQEWTDGTGGIDPAVADKKWSPHCDSPVGKSHLKCGEQVGNVGLN